MKKIGILCVAILVAVGVVSCGSHDVACASTAVVAKSGGGSSSGGGAKSGGGSSSGSKSSGGGSKSGSGSGSGSGSKSGSGSSGQSKTAQQSKAASASSPKSKPAPADASKAKAEAPKAVTRGGNYTSSVTGNTYVFHSAAYYRTPGMYVDIYDIYNPYNYWYYPSSPFYGMPYRYAPACGGAEKEVKADTNNINITIDNDGKIVSAEDKNPKDPDLEAPSENDGVPTEPPPTSAP